MNKFHMLVTYCLLPFYWLRSQFLRRFGSQSKINKELKMYPRHYLGFRGIKIVQHGQQPDPKVTCIYVSNHQSMNDIFIALGSVNRPFRFIAKKELFENFITGTFMKLSQSYPLDRDDARKSLLILKQVVADLKEGHSAFAFPEGTRSHQKDMLPFKDGMFSMLKKAEVPIVPLYIKESFNEKQKDFHVYYGEPVMPSTYNAMKGPALSEYMFETMNALKQSAYSIE